jgi:hypothetical protein
MGATAQSNIIEYLTDYAQGIGPGMVDPAAALIAPVVRVGSPIGKYKEFNDQNAFQVPSTARAVGGPAQRLEFSATDKDYNCTPQALEIGIDDIERAGGDPIAIEQAKVKTLMTAATRSHAVAVATLALTVAAAATPTWSSGSTAVDDLNTQIEALVNLIGEFPTDIVMGVTAWRRLVGNASVADKFKSGVINPAAVQAAQLLLAPSVRITVSPLIKDTAKPGATKATAQVYGSNVFIFYASPVPTQYDPSFMKTFRTAESGVDNVSSYRDESRSSDIYKVAWTQDIRITSTSSVKRLTVS